MTETELMAMKIGELAESMSDVATAFEKSIAHDRAGRRRWYMFVTVVLGVIAFGVFYYGKTLTTAADSSRNSTRILIECTTPGYKCYEDKIARNNQTTKDIVAGVDADLRGLVQSVCNLDPRQCPAGFHPQAPTSTSTTTSPPTR